MGSQVGRELDGRWLLGLRGSTLTSVDVQTFMVVLKFDSGSALTLESDVEVRHVSRRAPELEPQTRGDAEMVSTSDILTSSIGQRVLASVAFKSGSLRLVLESGLMLVVPFDEHYEAWQLNDQSGRMWISLPGGGLATFPPAEPSSSQRRVPRPMRRGSVGVNGAHVQVDPGREDFLY